MDPTSTYERDSLTESLPDTGELVRLDTVPSRYVTPVAVASKHNQPTFLSVLPPQTAAVMVQLAESLASDFIRPALMSGSADAYDAAISKNWHEFAETLHALHTLAARAASEGRAHQVARQSIDELTAWLRSEIVSLAGTDARDELDFACETLDRAMRIVARFPNPPASFDAKADRRLCARYRFATDVHFFALLSLDAAACGAGTTEPVIRRAFVLLRHGALTAYVAAQQAYDLRAPAAPDDNLAPNVGALDADDIALANAGLPPHGPDR